MRYALPIVLAALFYFNGELAGSDLRIVITSNLKGGFLSEVEGQEDKDPMLLLGQTILNERKTGDVLYIDLGNSFYPGIIAKYSFGSAVMDFFRHMNCAMTLVSSADLRIGINTLEFLQKGNPTLLMSGNLTRNGSPIFAPYTIHTVRDKRIAFIALSSRNILLDIAEKNLYQARMEDEILTLKNALSLLKKEAVSHIMLLSGLDDDINLALLKEFSGIGLIISGSDNSGGIFNKKIERAELYDGRAVIGASRSSGCYILDLELGSGIKVSDYRYIPSKRYRIEGSPYRDFISRITRWKEHFVSEHGKVLAVTGGKTIVFNDERVLNLLRDRFNTEISILGDNAVTPLNLDEKIRESDLLFSINTNYPVFIYRLSGSDIMQMQPLLKTFRVSGVTDGKVQNYNLAPGRFYSIASTQSIYDETQYLLKKDIPFVNTWMNIHDTALEDLKGKKVLLLNGYGYLDRRFRATADIFLSGFFNNTSVEMSYGAKPPAGSADKSLKHLGTEDRIDFTVYNSLHQFILTPYIFYEKENDTYIHNLLRGTLVYNLNLDHMVKPYHKSQADSVVISVADNRRPTTLRETAGVNIAGTIVKGKAGAGFEKEVHDPQGPPVYGFETILNVEVKFLSYFTYNLNIDSFMAYSTVKIVLEEKGYRRIEVENSMTFKFSQSAGIAVKHKWFRYYYIRKNDKYTNSQVIASFDLKTDFKIY